VGASKFDTGAGALIPKYGWFRRLTRSRINWHLIDRFYGGRLFKFYWWRCRHPWITAALTKILREEDEKRIQELDAEAAEFLKTPGANQLARDSTVNDG